MSTDAGQDRLLGYAEIYTQRVNGTTFDFTSLNSSNYRWGFHVSGINSLPSMANTSWWNNSVSAEETTNRTASASAPMPAHQDQVHASSAAQQSASSSYQPHHSHGDRMQALIEQCNPREAASTVGAHFIESAKSRMRHGTLSVFGTGVGERYGNLVYKASYKPHSPMNIENSSYSDILPGQSDLVDEHLEFYKDEFKRGLSDRQEPIVAAPTEHGALVVVEGHHRLAAALATGMPIKMLINADKEEAAEQDWLNIAKISKGDDGYETDVPSYKQRGL